ncbi:Hypothetical predicted protein [Pelobates cultripes]|uniref:Uncharacterized protein n=1 Tax=Pelobates cultripes TaxID=61616 RepID=A0AAD1S6Q9_PELCU|nr:Hypothetical predicted protein [Pelobates cultripes]
MRPCMHRAGEAVALPLRGYPATATERQKPRYSPPGPLGVNTVQHVRTTSHRGEGEVKGSRQATHLTANSPLMADTSCLSRNQDLSTETKLQTKLEAIMAAFWLKLENRALKHAPQQASSLLPKRHLPCTQNIPAALAGKRIMRRRLPRPQVLPQHKQKQSLTHQSPTFAHHRRPPVLITTTIHGTDRPRRTRPKTRDTKHHTDLHSRGIRHHKPDAWHSTTQKHLTLQAMRAHEDGVWHPAGFG